MDSFAFDRLTRHFSTSHSRRRLGGAMLGALAGLPGLRTVAARRCPPGKQACRRRCIAKRKCCTSAECRRKFRGSVCRRGRCKCRPGTKRCQKRCIPAAARCQPCPAGRLCVGDGECVATRAELLAALEPGGPDTIRLCPNSTFRGPINIFRSVTLVGAGANSTIFDGFGVGPVVLMSRFNLGVKVELRGIRIRNGLAGPGGGIVVEHGTDITLTDCVVNGNRASEGGGIWNAGSLTLIRSKVRNNTATDSGGGIWNGGGMGLVDSTVSNNQALSSVRADSGGGGIWSAGFLRLESSGVFDNLTTSVGGGIFSGPGEVELRGDSVVASNVAAGVPGHDFSGGGIWNQGGIVSFSDSTRVTGNQPNDCRGTTECPG